MYEWCAEQDTSFFLILIYWFKKKKIWLFIIVYEFNIDIFNFIINKRTIFLHSGNIISILGKYLYILFEIFTYLTIIWFKQFSDEWNCTSLKKSIILLQKINNTFRQLTY